MDKIMDKLGKVEKEKKKKKIMADEKNSAP